MRQAPPDGGAPAHPADRRAPSLHSTPSHAADQSTAADPPPQGPLGPTQSIVSVLNNPTQYSALKHLGLSKADAWMLVPPILAAGTLPDVRLEDFRAFLNATEREHQRYEAALQSEHDHKTASLLSGMCKHTYLTSIYITHFIIVFQKSIGRRKEKGSCKRCGRCQPCFLQRAFHSHGSSSGTL